VEAEAVDNPRYSSAAVPAVECVCAIKQSESRMSSTVPDVTSVGM
jgi:hypothetical protein